MAPYLEDLVCLPGIAAEMTDSYSLTISGQNALSEQGYKVFKHVYGRKASKPEVLNAICQQAYHRALSGHYDEALNTLMENDPRHLKTLRIDNIFIGFATMIRMRRAVHR